MTIERRDDQARGGQPARAEVGALVERLRELRRRRNPAATSGPPADSATARRITMLEERLAHLESALEGLQDALDRHAVLQDDRTADLRRRTEPEEMARALSEDARKRGV